MVHLLRGGEPVKMSKRSGNFVTLADVVSEVGRDVVRFSMLTRKADAQMDFDFEKVIEASKDNPVFMSNMLMPVFTPCIGGLYQRILLYLKSGFKSA